jgi:hypothetical protein
MSNFGELRENIKYKLDCLENQLSNESPIRPIAGFRLDFTTILGSLGVISTFTIVLLQYKLDGN